MMSLTTSRAIAGVAAITLLTGGCFFPPDEPEPEPAALAITDFVIDPNCHLGLCNPGVSGTVTNTGGLPTGGAPVTVDLSVSYDGVEDPSISPQDIPCATDGLAPGAACSFGFPSLPIAFDPDLLTVSVTAVASDGTLTSPPATDSYPLDLPTPP